MTLQYQLEINGQLTHFPEKVIRSLDISEPKKMTYYDLLSEVIPDDKQLNIHEFQELWPKLHTIRKDEKDRWKVGHKIHSKIWEGKPYHSNQYQFTPILEVKAIQNIEMVIRGIKGERPINVYIDGEVIGLGNGLEDLAKNDGFDSLEQFYDYFKDGFKGKLIHWTSFTY